MFEFSYWALTLGLLVLFWAFIIWVLCQFLPSAYESIMKLRKMMKREANNDRY